jgi:hypothetical protein
MYEQGKYGLTNSPSNTSTLSSFLGSGGRIMISTLFVSPLWGSLIVSRLNDCNRLTSADPRKIKRTKSPRRMKSRTRTRERAEEKRRQEEGGSKKEEEGR